MSRPYSNPESRTPAVGGEHSSKELFEQHIRSYLEHLIIIKFRYAVKNLNKNNSKRKMLSRTGVRRMLYVFNGPDTP